MSIAHRAENGTTATAAGTAMVPVYSGQHPTALFVFDAGIPATGRLAAALPPGSDIRALNRGANTLVAVAKALENAPAKIETLTLIARGEPGALLLHSGELSLWSMWCHSPVLCRISRALAPNCTLMLTAGRVAEGADGKAFLNALSAEVGCRVRATETVSIAGTVHPGQQAPTALAPARHPAHPKRPVAAQSKH